MNTKQSVLITGGAGFIGSHLAEALSARGFNVVIVDNLSTGSLQNLHQVFGNIQFFHCDILDDGFFDIIRNHHYDFIIHLAANSYVPPSVKNPRFDFDVNLLGSFMLMDFLRKQPKDVKIIYASSAAVYGDPSENPISENTNLAPISPYGVSKLAAERYFYVFSKLYGLRTTILRFFSVYGPRQKKQLIYDMMVKMKHNPQQIEVFGDGTQTRDLLYVDDLVKVICLVMEKSSFQGDVINVGSGVGYPIIEIIQQIAQALNVKPIYHFTGNVRPGDPLNWVADINKLRNIGFEPTFSLEKGIGNTVSWFLACSEIKKDNP